MEKDNDIAARKTPAAGATRKPAATKTASSAARRPAASRTTGKGIRHKKKKKCLWAPWVLVGCAAAILCMGFVGLSEYRGYSDYLDKCALLSRNTFYDGITLEGESLAGMTLDEAAEKYNGRFSNVAQNTSIVISANGKEFTIDSSAVQLSADLQYTLKQAYYTGRTGTFEERLAAVDRLRNGGGKEFSLNRAWNEEVLHATIEAIAKQVYVKGTDAQVAGFDPSHGKFSFTREVTGYELDSDDLYQQVTQAIANGNMQASITAKVDTVKPKYDLDYMEDHFGRISVATTTATSNSNRNTNIRLASACFNGMRVEPGQTVSFNETTGKRSEEKGYMEAGAYQNGIYIQDFGGGTCQVSTTLYNALAKADIEIVESSPHNRPSDYVGIGLDAAVNYPSQDMKFKNNTGFPIFIVSEFEDRKLTFKIYGKQMDDGVYIKLESEQTEVLEPPEGVKEVKDGTLPVGQTKTEKAREGYRAQSYKVYYDSDNHEFKREPLRTTTYRASSAILRIGTGTDLDH